MIHSILYAAAHAEFPDALPLGGGKAVADFLIREWRREESFPLTVLSPQSLRLELRTPLAQMSELEYARFCRQFERAATAEILRRGPRECVVLSNDISEGPDFRVLGERGYRVVTIFHVDVVEYFTKFYLGGLVRPEWAAKLRGFGLMPDVLRLVFQKQYDCVRHSARLVVPSEPMRETIRRCYPWCPAEKIVVLPWGIISEPVPATANLPLLIGEEEFVILTLSRLSPEKGIERLLQALGRLDTPNCNLRVLVCGAAAYMKGRSYERKLRRLAARLRHVHVDFTGHVVGAQKAALLQRADVFVSASRHESYGLTIGEALAAGCRVISHMHYGATGRVVDCADLGLLAGAIREMVQAGRMRKDGSVATAQRSSAAQRLAELLQELARTG